MTILSLDGGKNIGWAVFTEPDREGVRGVISYQEFFRRSAKVFGRGTISSDIGLYFEPLETPMDITDIVVEGIRHNPSISQGGSQHWESQVEGAARMLGVIFDIPVTVQPPNILPVALMHEQMEWPKTRTGKKKHLPDDLAAWLHGRYYLRSIGLLD